MKAKTLITKASLAMAFLLLLSESCKKDTTQPASNLPVTVPDALKTSPDEIQVASYYGVGTQNYEAQADPDNPGQAKWVFIEPSANLYDNNGNVVVVHSKGPVWQYVADGSTVTGIAVANVPSPVASENIPWLLLSNKENGGSGLFTTVNMIQRLDTRGGLAPTTPPSPDMIGTTIKIPYSALYVFYKKK